MRLFTHCNVNSRCRVILNRRGVEAMRAHYEALKLPTPDVFVGQYHEMKLWEAMHIFGPAWFMGTEPPFEPWFEIEL